jgi:ankyrin repeat protein
MGCAIQATRLDVLRYLLERGLNPEVRDTHGHAALHVAARYGEIEAARLLLAAGVDIESKTFLWETPLFLAAHYLHMGTDVADLLIQAGAVIDLNSALRLRPADEIISQLTNPTAAVRAISEHTLLRDAIDAKWRLSEEEVCQIIVLLVNSGIDPNLPRGWRPPLLSAVSSSKTPLSVVKTLLDCGANPAMPIHRGSILDVAREMSSPEIVDLIEQRLTDSKSA